MKTNIKGFKIHVSIEGESADIDMAMDEIETEATAEETAKQAADLMAQVQTIFSGGFLN
jgi:hypothetical protein